jgi:hypothetical protein
MKQYLPFIAAMLFGVAVHIAKKAMTLKKTDPAFSLKGYLLDYPYQTFLTFASAAGVFLGLVSGDALTLSSAFLGGVAANSLGDAAPGER